MTNESTQLASRCEHFALAVIKLCAMLPPTMASRRIGGQLFNAATSVAANYRAARRAYTRPLFVSKLAIVAEEADESQFWLSMLVKSGTTTPVLVAPLLREAGELTAIFTASLSTARRNTQSRRRQPASGPSATT